MILTFLSFFGLRDTNPKIETAITSRHSFSTPGPCAKLTDQERRNDGMVGTQNSSYYKVGFASHKLVDKSIPIGSMYGIYANLGGILMVNVTIYI